MVSDPVDFGHAVTPTTIVAGGAHGVAGEVARALAAAGHAVVITYMNDQVAADGAVDRMLAAHGTALAVRADVRDTYDVRRLFDETAAAFGAVDVVVLGTGDPGLLEREAALRLAAGGLIVAFPGRLRATGRGDPAGLVTRLRAGGWREVVVVPVADVARARRFYLGLGWRGDAAGVTLLPPGSRAAVVPAADDTPAAPGSADVVLRADGQARAFNDPDGNRWVSVPAGSASRERA